PFGPRRSANPSKPAFRGRMSRSRECTACARTRDRPTPTYVGAFTRNCLEAFEPLDLVHHLRAVRALPPQHRDHCVRTEIGDAEGTRHRSDRIITDSERRLGDVPVVERDETCSVEFDRATQPGLVLHD